MQMTPKSFSDSYFNSLFSCYPFCCNKMFSVSFLSLSRLYFSLQDFCLARVTARFLLIFKGCCQTYCQTNKQIKAGGKNNSCVTIEIIRVELIRVEIIRVEIIRVRVESIFFKLRLDCKQKLSEGEQKTTQ